MLRLIRRLFSVRRALRPLPNTDRNYRLERMEAIDRQDRELPWLRYRN